MCRLSRTGWPGQSGCGLSGTSGAAVCLCGQAAQRLRERRALSGCKERSPGEPQRRDDADHCQAAEPGRHSQRRLVCPGAALRSPRAEALTTTRRPMMRLIALTVVLSLFLVSCARGCVSSPKQAAPAAAPTAAQQEPPTAPNETTPQESENQQAAAAQEKGDDPETDRSQARSDAGLERLAQLPADQQLPAGRWKAGQNYDVLVPSQPTSVAPGKIEVVEVFWLGCPHCYALEPYIQSWLKNKPDYIQFIRVPVMWGPVHRGHARLFYTLMALNRPDLVQQAFDTIQQKHEMLVGASDDATLKAQQAFAQQFGISA